MNWAPTKQLECFEFLKAYIAEHGYSPTYQVLADGLGSKSKSRVWELVQRLEERGLVKTLNNKRCGIQIVQPQFNNLALKSNHELVHIRDLANEILAHRNGGGVPSGQARGQAQEARQRDGDEINGGAT